MIFPALEGGSASLVDAPRARFVGAGAARCLEDDDLERALPRSRLRGGVGRIVRCERRLFGTRRGRHTFAHHGVSPPWAMKELEASRQSLAQIFVPRNRTGANMR